MNPLDPAYDPAYGDRHISRRSWGRTLEVAPSATVFEKFLSLDGLQEGLTLSACFPPQENILTRNGVLQVRWNSGSAPQIAEADIGRGQVLHVAGSNVEIWVRNSSTSGTALIALTAHLENGGGAQGTRTPPRQVIAAAGSADYDVPNFAREVTVYRTDATTTDLLVQILGVSTTLTAFAVNGGELCPAVLLPESAVQIRVHNLSGASTVGTVVFALRI